MDEGGIRCRGVGRALPGEEFSVNANGMDYDVIVVTAIVANGTPAEWTAMDRDQYERIYRQETT
jgi:hypothetical protein